MKFLITFEKDLNLVIIKVMKSWKLALIAAASASILVLIILLLICWTNWPRRVPQANHTKHQDKTCTVANLQPNGSEEPLEVGSTTSTGHPFEWKKHPALMADALDRGWTAFALSYLSFPTSTSPMRWKSNSTGGSIVDETFLPEVAWEMAGPGTDLVQLIRLNPSANIPASIQTMYSALPLPGPFTVQSTFPQEAYFEITIVSQGPQERKSFSFNRYDDDDDRTKLIQTNKSLACMTKTPKKSVNIENQTISEGVELIEKGWQQIDPAMEKNDKGLQSNEEIENEETQVIALGLTRKDAPPFHLPGTYWGSVGFQSTGRIMLNGAPCQQGFQIGTTANTTFGCGFHPFSQKILFTANGELVAEVFGTKSEFGQPLFVAVGANCDTKIMVNFGQSPFIYDAANNKRVEDPSCKLKTPPRHIKSWENSTDFLTMRLTGSNLPQDFDTFSLKGAQHSHAVSTTDSDFFEIALEGITSH